MMSMTNPTKVTPSREQALKRLQVLSRAARFLALVGIVLTLGYEVWLAVFPDRLLASLPWADAVHVQASQSVIGIVWLLQAIPALAFVLALISVRHLFGLLGSGNLMTADVAASLRRTGHRAIIAALTGFLATPVAVLALTWLSLPASPIVLIEVSSEQLTALIVGLILYAFAEIVREAIVLEDDLRGFV